MNGSDLLRADISQLGRAIAARELSPVELVADALGRIEALDGELNAFITTCGDDALRRARQLEQEVMDGHVRGPLHGVPFSVKDVFLTEGLRTTAGSRVLADHVPGTTAVAVRRVLDSGAVLIGKTNTHEFHAGATNENEHFGQCHNPWNPSLISGGSSGGSGVAVATGMGVFSLGADTGGSIRIPSALCGVVGIKPTFGRVDREGMLPEAWTLDHCGPLARCVDDCAVVLQALQASRSRDGVDGLAGVRVGVPRADALGPLDAGVAAAFESALQLLEELGALLVRDLAWPAPDLVSDALQVIIWSEAATYHQQWLRERGDEYSREVRAKFDRGLLLRACDYLQAQRVRAAIADDVRAATADLDVVGLPTVPVPAPRPGTTVEIDGVAHDIERTLARLTPVANLVGAPAISVRAGLTSDGLPVGLMLQGRYGDDEHVIAIARHVENAGGLKQLRAPLDVGDMAK